MEIWKDIKGFEGCYQVSNYGNIKSFMKDENGSILSNSIGKEGYAYVMLVGEKNVLRRIHRLVAEHFLDEDASRPYVNHINGVKNDNRVENLEWCTQLENVRHAIKIGKNNPRNKSSNKLTFNTETGIYYDRCIDAANAHGYKKTTLIAMLIGQNKNKSSLIYV